MGCLLLALLKDPPLTLLVELSTDMLKKRVRRRKKMKQEVIFREQRTQRSTKEKNYEICEGKMRLESQVDNTM
jgi:hypothetical protein